MAKPSQEQKKEHTNNTDETIAKVHASESKANDPEKTFDPEVKRLMDLIESIKNKTSSEDTLLIIAKTGENQPIVFAKGHPYDVTEMTARYIREMKGQLFDSLDC